jgi:hypothetical protein
MAAPGASAILAAPNSRQLRERLHGIGLGDRPETVLTTYPHLLPSSDAAAADAVAAAIVDKPLTDPAGVITEPAN